MTRDSCVTRDAESTVDGMTSTDDATEYCTGIDEEIASDHGSKHEPIAVVAGGKETTDYFEFL